MRNLVALSHITSLSAYITDADTAQTMHGVTISAYYNTNVVLVNLPE
jgi:hypothetical protein